MYDPPHLLKNIRNNLKRNGFIVDGNEIAWKHIERFYAIDASLPIRMAPRLTERHITLPAFSSMKVSLAAQMLKHSVAAGITTLCMISDKLDSEAIHTAKFLEQFNKLFDVFNSRTMAGPNNFYRGITAESNHVIFSKNVCNGWRLSPPSENLECYHAWKGGRCVSTVYYNCGSFWKIATALNFSSQTD